jgi:hypothetical protein
VSRVQDAIASLDRRALEKTFKSASLKRVALRSGIQGMLYELIPTMPELRLLPLVQRFAEMLAEIPAFADTFGAV